MNNEQRTTDLLDPDRLKANLKTKRIGGKILVYKRTSSTNDVAAEYAAANPKSKIENPKSYDGLVIFAEQQTAGRGRAGTEWYSGFGDSILCSVLLADCKCSGELLSLSCAVAVAEAVDKPGDSPARIKWPNDVRLKDKKVAGILVESRQSEIGKVYIAGVGINCHQTPDSFGAELRNSATSIDIESGTVCDRVSLAKRLLVSMDNWLGIARTGGEKVLERWRQLSIQLNHRVTLVYNGASFTGICIGIDPQKGLILQLDTGGVRMFDAAHTTIAK